MSDSCQLLMGVLSVWRVTHLIQAEDGPWDVVVKARRVAGNGSFGRLFDCFYCLSLWVAAPLAYWIGNTRQNQILMWLAFSGASILLERSVGQQGMPQKPLYFEAPKEQEHGMLRTTAELVRRDETANRN
jgi:hypothetical protein